MVKDKRYNLIKNEILTGHLTDLTDLIEIITISQLKTDLRTHYDTLSGKVVSPDKFTFGDAYKIAALIGVDDEYIIKMIDQHHKKGKKSKKVK